MYNALYLGPRGLLFLNLIQSILILKMVHGSSSTLACIVIITAWFGDISEVKISKRL